MGRLSASGGWLLLLLLSNWNGLNWFWLTSAPRNGRMLATTALQCMGIGLDWGEWSGDTFRRSDLRAASDHVGAGKLGSHAGRTD